MEVRQVWNAPNANATNNQLGFFTATGTTQTERMSILANGNVGVAQTAPAAKLDVNGSILARGVNAPTTGVGVEIDYGGIAGTGRIIAVDRSNGNAYKPFRVGNGFDILANGDVSGIGAGSFNGLLTAKNRAVITGNTANQEALVVDQTQTGTIADFRRAGTSKLMIADNGFVGISTVGAPVSLLHLSSATNNYITLDRQSSATGEAGIRFTTANSPKFFMFQDNNSEGLQFESGLLSNPTDGLPAENDNTPRLLMPAINRDIYALLSGGRLGLGTSSPAGLVHLNALNPEIFMTTTGGTAPWGAIRGNGATWLFGYGGMPGNEEISIGTQDNTPSQRTVTLSAGGSKRMTVAANGSVGIGTADPLSTLHLYGTGSTYLYLERSDAMNSEAGIQFGSNTPGSKRFWIFQNEGTEDVRFEAYGLPGETDQVPRMTLNANDKNILACQSGGTFAIGNMSPDNSVRLHVGGDARIDGTLQVASLNTKVWSVAPDYVFEKGYKLDSLEHVEKYVDEHKHLPDIPSAKDFKEKGLDLADMNMKLLRKVEELTLYAIQQEKKDRQRDQEMAELKQTIASLKVGRK
jgi:hypothetical protein